MATLEKYIFETWQDLFSYLEDKGFIFDDNKIIWDAGPNNIDAYWFHNPNHDINFYTSEGNNAFYHNLTDFEHDKYCGCIFIPLQDDGCILYLSPVDVDFDITDLQLCCINNYNSSYVAGSNPLENGVVVFTPAEADGYWRYSWRGQDPINHKWCVDNTRGIVTEGTEIPYVQIIPADLTITLLKTYLSNGSWSNYIYTQVLGDVTTPGNVFKINGQKFISITDNTTYRCPAFKLPQKQ